PVLQGFHGNELLYLKGNKSHVSTYQHYMKFNNLSIFEIKNNIDENIKEVKKILNENRFDYYLNKFYVNKFINELRFFSYNSDGRNEIYKILYTLYNESVHFEKDSFKDIS
ncbi:MAG: hypothetical protein K2X69_01000, partial [Silvanigrellaceae bacterium]|nr:hypothetical protein [Silvanigrellaceae bacterium]